MAKTHPDIKWIKIATNIFADEKILLIEQMPEGDSIIVIWFKLLCMAGKENNCGVFVMGGRIPYTEEMLATIFRRNLQTVRLALSTFEAFGMIEIIEDASGNDVITVPNWEKHQSTDAMDKIREQTRKRVAKHRENQRLAIGCNVTSNVTVTEGNATEENREEEKRKEENREEENRNNYPDASRTNDRQMSGQTHPEIEKEKELETEPEKKKRKASSPPIYIENSELNSAIIAFVDYRKRIKKPMTEKAVELMIKKLNDLSPYIEDQIEILNQSILNGWQGIFPLKKESYSSSRSANIQNRVSNIDNW